MKREQAIEKLNNWNFGNVNSSEVEIETAKEDVEHLLRCHHEPFTNAPLITDNSWKPKTYRKFIQDGLLMEAELLKNCEAGDFSQDAEYFTNLAKKVVI